jgi:hypothetical protein
VKLKYERKKFFVEGGVGFGSKVVVGFGSKVVSFLIVP